MDLRDSRWDHLLILLIAAAGCLLAKPVPALAEAAANEPDLLPIQVEEPRPVAAALREISARHGLVITYEDPRWAHASELDDVTDQMLSRGALRPKGRERERVLIPRKGSLEFSYRWSDLQTANSGAERLIAKLVEASSGFFAARYQQGVFHVVPTLFLSSDGSVRPHESPLEASIRFPTQRRTIRDTLRIIVEKVNEVSTTPLSFGLVAIRPFDQRAVELGSDGRTARELLVEAMHMDDLKTSWLLLYDPTLRRYFFSVYPVRDPKMIPPETPDAPN